MNGGKKQQLGLEQNRLISDSIGSFVARPWVVPRARPMPHVRLTGRHMGRPTRPMGGHTLTPIQIINAPGTAHVSMGHPKRPAGHAGTLQYVPMKCHHASP